MQDLRNSLREAEQNCNKMYANLTQSSSSQMQKLLESQKKFEEASVMITRQSSMIEELNKQVERLKEINTQLEYSWDQKYNQMIEVKETDMASAAHQYKI